MELTAIIRAYFYSKNFEQGGIGTLTLSNSNSIATTNIIEGGIKLGNAIALEPGTVTVADGAFVDLNGQIVSNSFDVQGVSGGGALKNSGTRG